MIPTEVLQDYESLPSEAQQQVIDFIAFMKSRYQKPTPVDETLSIEGSFGLLKANRTITFEEMDRAINISDSR